MGYGGRFARSRVVGPRATFLSLASASAPPPTPVDPLQERTLGKVTSKVWEALAHAKSKAWRLSCGGQARISGSR